MLAETLAPNPKGGLCAARRAPAKESVLSLSRWQGLGGEVRYRGMWFALDRRHRLDLAVRVLAAPRTIAPVDPTAIKQRVGGVFPNVRDRVWTATGLPPRSSGSRTCASCCACAVARIARGPAMPDLPAERRGSGLLLRPGKEIRVSGPAARVCPCDGRLAVRRERRRGVRR